MIYGIGTDVCDIRRIAATLARRGERFAERVLGPHEFEVFRARRAKVEARGIAYLNSFTDSIDTPAFVFADTTFADDAGIAMEFTGVRHFRH